MNKNIIILGVVILALVGILFIFNNSNNDVNLVKSDKFEQLVNSKDVFVLQVHTPYYGEIDGTDLVVEDWKNIDNYLNELPEKDQPIAIYCRSGRMSGIVAQQLKELGYTNVYDLDGGMNSWEESGMGIVIKER